MKPPKELWLDIEEKTEGTINTDIHIEDWIDRPDLEVVTEEFEHYIHESEVIVGPWHKWPEIDPPEENLYLVCDIETGKWDRTYFRETKNQDRPLYHGFLTFTPTHWAEINLPETAQHHD